MKRVSIGLLLALVGCIIFLTANSSAAPEKDKEKKKVKEQGIPYQDYILNDININNPNGQICSTQNTATGELTGENVEKVLKFFTGKGLTLMQAAAIAGNLQQESRIDPNALNSIGAYGIAQWLGGRRTNLEKKPNYSTIEGQLEYLWEELNGAENAGLRVLLKYSGSGGTTNRDILAKPGGDVGALAVEFGETFERYGPNEEGNRAQYAAEIFNSYNGKIQDGDPSKIASGIGGDSSGAQISSASATGCSGNGSSVAGQSIVDTAKQLAWNPNTDKGANNQTAKAEYIDAVKKNNPSVVGSSDTDCGRFVATVLRTSGADKDYQPIGTTDQYTYVKSHPEKFKIIDRPSASDLQPGDILLHPSHGGYGHTLIYTGDVGGGYVAANASLGDTVPIFIKQGSVDYQLTQPGNILVRVIQSNKT